MERSAEDLDFENIDQMIRLQGTFIVIFTLCVHQYEIDTRVDLPGVSILAGHDANHRQKAAVGEATNIFRNNYFEVLIHSSDNLLSCL